MEVKSESEVAQLCLTSSEPMDYSHQAPHGIFQARVLEWGAIAFSEYSDKNLKNNNKKSPSKQNANKIQFIPGKIIEI